MERPEKPSRASEAGGPSPTPPFQGGEKTSAFPSLEGRG
ncbi:hypothetical protein C725_1057 [Pacificimonas flava]|uniref:Uncharacterized protein n=1 Tax=Pacificimonas flava TaxID=1234595 RepID=M2TN28_9SPHN|nr:hypothetical protein C725_1057 [Pacificimonas flava]